MRGVLVLGGVGVGLVMAGCGGSGGEISAQTGDYRQSQAQMRRLIDALRLYAEDNNALPIAGQWMSRIRPYKTVLPTDFTTPALPQYGYAMNADIAGRRLGEFDQPATIALFDSTVIEEGATAGTDTLPRPGRYGGRNTIAYLDGFVQGTSVYAPALYPEARRRVSTLAQAASLYAADHDNRYPGTDWADSMASYLKSPRGAVSPLFDHTPDKYGFALSQGIAGKSVSELSPGSVAFFDSENLSRSAVDSTTTMPAPGRYGDKNAWARVDGSLGN